MDGTSSGTCTGAQTADVTPIGQPGSPGTGATVPVDLCGVQGSVDGSASAACPEPSTSPSTITPDGGSSGSGAGSSPTGATGSSTGGSIPATLTANPASPGAASATAAVTPAGALAQTGAPILFELVFGAAALLAGLVLSMSGRLRRTQS